MWIKRIGAGGFKVGVVWQGNPDPAADRARSVPLAALAPLAEVPGVRLISLQKGSGEEQLSTLPSSMRVETLGADFDAGTDAFVDTAAAMTCLDLVVTCDTSIAHLAGALALPVWVALKIDAEWRWLTERADSPWYPTMRLFRQARRGVWGDVFEAMALELVALAAARAAAPRMFSTPCSLGELIDKITILRIKAERIREEEKLDNVRRELASLERLAHADGPSGPPIDWLTDTTRGRKRASVEYRGCNSDMRTQRGLRAALCRARAIGVRRKRCARRDKTRHQHARQLGPRRGEELRLMRLIPKTR